ncbi:MAG: lysophospholipid acyltransferase family protein, partial [Planctomycetes bacterium]|nr:lysophospholipid acyltransferase family protein [Planctomycetota bacterium]
HLDKVMDKKKGCLAITGHFGSWELMAAAVCDLGYPVDLLVGRQKNRMVDDLFNRLRSCHGLGLIPLDKALRGVFRSLRDGRMVALLGDQDARRGAGVEVDFFGRPTSTYPGAALFAIKGKSGLICPFIVRKGKSLDHTVFIEPALEFDAGEDREKAIVELTQRHTACLEAWIKKHPDHWFWGHRRWKSQGLYRNS